MTDVRPTLASFSAEIDRLTEIGCRFNCDATGTACQCPAHQARARIADALVVLGEPQKGPGTFQDRVRVWMLACFGAEIAADREERNHRFLEEALEVVQAAGCTASEARQLVDYVYQRPVGQLHQEIGGAAVTLAALCSAHGEQIDVAGEDELARVWKKIERVREKQRAKPKHSPLPEALRDPQTGHETEKDVDARR